MDEAFQKKARQFFDKVKQGICPICNEPMEQKMEGSTVYASSCGHILSLVSRARLVLERGPERSEGAER